MSRPLLAILLSLALAAAALAAGCGEEEELDVIEGEPLELGELRFNVQITRFLNPDDPEDEGYLAGQDPPEPGEAYLGVFLTIENEGDETATVPDGFRVLDTAEREYEPIPSGSAYALQFEGAEEEPAAGIESGTVDDLQAPTIPPGGEIPEPDTTAADGVIGGSMLLFLVDQNVAENRPLELEVPAEGEVGFVELDI